MKNKKFKLLGCLLLALVLCLAFTATALAVEGQAPEHHKSVTPNGDGTLKIELNVTGESKPQDAGTAGGANVVIVYDVSSSMTYNTASGSTRAIQAENVVNDFLSDLADVADDGADIRVALVTFAATLRPDGNSAPDTGWTSKVTETSNPIDTQAAKFSSGTTPLLTYTGGNHNGTNWEAGLTRANTLINDTNRPNDNPTFVILITDGGPTANEHNNTITTPGDNTRWIEYRQHYNYATDEAFAIAQATEATGGAFFSIYAFGTDADLLDDLMYYAYHPNSDKTAGTHRTKTYDGTSLSIMDVQNTATAAANYDFGDTDNDTADESTNFILASDKTTLDAAIVEIFEQIVAAVGITNVGMGDGTPSSIPSDVIAGASTVSLLQVEPESGFEYFLTFPADGTFKDRMGRDVTVAPKEGDSTKVIVSWREEGATADTTAEYTLASPQPNNGIKVIWDSATPFEVAPPAATYEDSSVKWNLNFVLQNEVTYSVEFDVWPAQDALDLIAQLKNGDIAYDDLDKEIQDNLIRVADEDDPDDDTKARYEIKTNTDTTFTYTDTRTDDGPVTGGSFTDEIPNQPAKAIEEMTVAKEWVNELDSQERQPLSLKVLMGEKVHHTMDLPKGDKWSDKVYVSIGIMSYDNTTKAVTVREGAEGHDFSFAEPEGMEYYWQLDAPTVHPMLINGAAEPTMLVKVEADELPDGVQATLDDGKTDGTYFKIGSGYYKIDAAAASLTAYNNRKSYLDVVKKTEGDGPEDALFTFKIKIEQPEEAAPAPAEPEPSRAATVSNDTDIWFSIYNAAAEGAFKYVMNVAEDGNEENETYITGATAEIVDLDDPDGLNIDPEDIDYDADGGGQYGTYTYPVTYNDGSTGTKTVLAADDTATGAEPTYEAYTGYYFAPNKTELTIKLQKDWSLRFLNLPTETTYEIEEDATEMPDHFSFKTVEGERKLGKNGDPEEVGTQAVDNSDPDNPKDLPKISGSIDDPNYAYKMTFTNEYQLATVKVVKTFSGLAEGEDPIELFPDFVATVSFDPVDQTATKPDDIPLRLDTKEPEEEEEEELSQTETASKADTTTNAIVPVVSDDGLTYTWTIKDLDVGLNVTVTESGYECDDYTFIAALPEGEEPEPGVEYSKITDDTLGDDKEDPEDDTPTSKGTPTTLTLTNNYQGSGGTLKIVKIVTGSADVPADAEFTITGEGLEEAVVVYFEDFVYDEEQSNDTKDVYVYEYPEELPAGNYTVTEKAATAQVPGYSLYLFGESGDSLPMTEDGLVVTIRNDYHLKSSYVPEELNGEDHYAYMIGYPDGLVQPHWNITRAEVATIFFRLLTDEAREANLTTVNSFGDVNDGQWFNVSVSTMANMGIVNGYPDGDFHPNDNITRAEFAAIAARFDKEAKDSANIFTDIDGHWAKSYILRAVNRGWINGYPDSTFRPDRLATRAEVAAMVNRVLVRDPEDPDDLLPDMIEWPDNMDTNAWYYLDIQEATNTHEYERVTKPTEVWIQMLENPDWTKYQY